MLLAPKAFLIGILRAVTGVKSVVLLYAANLLFGALITVPVFFLASDALAWSPATRSFLTTFDPEFITDLFRTNEQTFGAVEKTAMIGAIIYYLLYVFLLGGVYMALAERTRPLNFTTFFAACGRHVFPFVRVLIPAGVALALLVWLNDLVSGVLTWFFNGYLDRGASDTLLGWTLTGKVAIFLLLFGLVVVLPVEFARIRCVVDNDRAMLRGYWRGLILCLRNPLTVLSFLVLSTLLLVAIYAGHDLLLRRLDWTAPLRPLSGFGWEYDPSLSPATAYLVLGQGVLFLVQAMFVQRAAGLLLIYEEVAAPPAPLDPELVYAHSLVVDAPLPRDPRRPRRGYPFQNEARAGGNDDR